MAPECYVSQLWLLSCCAFPIFSGADSFCRFEVNHCRSALPQKLRIVQHLCSVLEPYTLNRALHEHAIPCEIDFVQHFYCVAWCFPGPQLKIGSIVGTECVTHFHIDSRFRGLSNDVPLGVMPKNLLLELHHALASYKLAKLAVIAFDIRRLLPRKSQICFCGTQQCCSSGSMQQRHD